MPGIGFLGSGTARPTLPGFRLSLNETGYVESLNVTVEHRWAENREQLATAVVLAATAESQVKERRQAKLAAGCADGWRGARCRRRARDSCAARRVDRRRPLPLTDAIDVALLPNC
jgi:hypothetical protein